MAVLVSVSLTLLLGSLLIRRTVEEATLRNLARQADLLAAREEQSGGARPAGALNRRQGGRGEERFAVIPLERAGAILPADAVAALRGGMGVEGRVETRNRDLLYAARPLGEQVLVVTRPATLRFADWRPFAGSFVVAGLVGAGIAAVMSFLLARTIARPVQRVVAASRTLAAGSSPERVPVEGPDELAELARSFNRMADELGRAREAERSFLLSVSHELKTPLTAIRGYAEALGEGAVAPGEAGEILRREASRLERLVGDLLDLARMNQRSFSVRRDPVDLTEVARSVVQRYESQARDFGVSLAANSGDGASALGDPDRLLQVVSNLVENAIRCAPQGGLITVSAGPGELAVADTGPGLAPDDLPRAFERFYLYRRYEDERPVGSGLGLPIVKELTEAMGGSVAVASTPGRGATFTVRLPVL